MGGLPPAYRPPGVQAYLPELSPGFSPTLPIHSSQILGRSQSPSLGRVGGDQFATFRLGEVAAGNRGSSPFPRRLRELFARCGQEGVNRAASLAHPRAPGAEGRPPLPLPPPNPVSLGKPSPLFSTFPQSSALK